MDAVDLLEQPHAEAQRLLATGAPVYMTVNPVEFHGPHLSLHNDRLLSRGLNRDIHRRLSAGHPGWPFLVAHDLEVGAEGCPGPGTRLHRYQLVRELVVEACRALHELGARRVVIGTFHGAPLHNLALQAGVDWLTSHGVRAIAPFNIALRELLHVDDVKDAADALATIDDPAERARAAAELPHDFHAGYFETSVALHYAPHSVSTLHRALPPCPPVTPDLRLRAAARAARTLGRDELARELEFAAMGMGWSALRPFPGYTGRPHLASAAAGAHFARYILDKYEPVVEAVLCGDAPPPPPIMAWLGTISAGGRIGNVPRPPLSDIGLPPHAYD